jgi:hypothetical protein
MQGQYSGPWHSDGDYHFSAFGTDLDLKVTIDGTLALTVGPDGRVSGTATGTVDAPIYDYGRRDVSSGYGTISGTVSGSLTGSGSTLVLNTPVIFMHWGTFVGGGYTVDQNITMPDYSLAAGGSDCISASGTVAETNFPPKWIVPDGSTMAPVMVPGIGSATGTWSATSADAALYTQLSQQVDSFISSANAMLSGGATSYADLQATIITPLKSLIATINSHPTVARCLQERLGAWESSAAAALYARGDAALSLLPADGAARLPTFRSAIDSVRGGASLGSACSVPDGGVSGRLDAALSATLTGAAASTSGLPTAALLAREALLWHGDQGRAALHATLNDAVHARLGASSTPSSLLDTAREAYLFGDDVDATTAFGRLTAAAPKTSAHAAKHKGGKSKKKKKKGHKPKPTPTPKPKPTATPVPKTLESTIAGGIPTLQGKATSGSSPTFSWNAPKTSGGAPIQYVVAVTVPGSPGLLWSWSGTATSVPYGDTTLPDVPGSAGDGWSVPLPSGYRWSVLAISNGSVVGIKLR